MDRLRRQVWIDVLLLIVVVVVLITGYILDFRLIERPGRGVVKNIHIYGGYVMTALVIVHIVQYFKVLLNKMRVLNKK
ncbi:MAG: DUF4405 domain-containing protein [Selenomonadales bacterium]|nr:DUF4405 domain-containing protein [Selenomonadales bacterium]